MPNTWQTPTQLAESLGVSRGTVWRWATRGLVEVRRRAAKTGVRMRLRTPEEMALLTGAYVLDEFGGVRIVASRHMPS